MADLSELFWRASLEEVKRGYIDGGSDEGFTCLICGRYFERGEVFSDEGRFYEAERSVKRHILREHGSVFQFLLGMDRRYTGLTDLQKKLLELFHQGLPDQAVVKTVGGGSTSTVRNHRFALREREKQAKVFLALMELLAEKTGKKPRFVEIHRAATAVDERFAITPSENEKYLRQYFKEGPDGPLAEFPAREKRKIVVLRQIAKRFESGRKYAEQEINAVLGRAYHDYVTLRRYLVEYGFLDRTPDGGEYWVKT